MSNSSNSVNPNMKFTPNQRVVVVPPPRIYKFSMYDELRLGEDKYKEIKTAMIQTPKSIKREKRNRTIQNIFGLAMLAALGVLGYRHREGISNTFKKLFRNFKKNS